ncbi:hypothetical protein [Botrimarina sp.]|uniref:hypothetical protein n=1 Tax=Botrimarina sp. TaxID=2795802 RepID=UPI0032EB98C1
MAPATVPVTSPALARRWAIYTALIAVSLGQAAGKILAVDSVDLTRLERYRIEAAMRREADRLEEAGVEDTERDARMAARRERLEEEMRLGRPFLSANDRSRWLAIRAIAENGVFYIDPLLEEPTWDTIDMVKHAGPDGEPRLYSSKPPLLMVLIAGPYWVLMQLTGSTLGESPYLIGRTLLLLLNVGSLAVMLTSVACLVERFGRRDTDRVFAMTAICFATQLSSFAAVLNNHLFAAAATALATELWLGVIDIPKPTLRRCFATGVVTAFAVTCELPALALAAWITLSLLLHRPKSTLKGFLPGALLVAVALFGTNYLAHDSLRPPYAHRSETDPADNWYDYEYTVGGKTRDSYWRDRQGIDVGEPSKARYALHALVGHHGVFSLTPVWIVSVFGLVRMAFARRGATREFAWGVLLVSAACLAFYLGLRPQDDRNYGGMTTGFRWLYWLAPLWAAALPAAIRRLKRTHIGMAFAVACLAWSAMSASYPTWNPWTHPWIYQWMDYLGFELP